MYRFVQHHNFAVSMCDEKIRFFLLSVDANSVLQIRSYITFGLQTSSFKILTFDHLCYN